MAETIAVIKWTRLKRWRDVLKCNGENDRGLYQILGNHAVFGERALLYIGITENRTFAERFTEHEEWLEKEWETEIYLGRIVEINGSKDLNEKKWTEVLRKAEQLLIYFHSPPYNERYISEVPESKNKYFDDLRLFNVGYYGSLYPEVSSLRIEKDKIFKPIFEKVEK